MATRILFMALLLVLWAAVPPVGHAQPAVELRIDSIDASRLPSVRVQASVIDPQGRPIAGLGPENFVIADDGRMRPVVSEVTSAPASIVLAIDTSCAISLGLDQLKRAVAAFVESLAPAEQVALVLIDHEVRAVRGFSADHAALMAEVDALTLESLQPAANLHGGVSEAIRMAAAQPVGRRAVALLASGQSSPGGVSLGEVRQLAIDQRVPVHVVAVGDSIDDGGLRALAADGHYALVNQAPLAADTLRAIAAELRPRYTIQFEATPGGNGGLLSLMAYVPDRGTASAPIPLLQPLPTPTPTVTATAAPTVTATAAPTLTPTPPPDCPGCWIGLSAVGTLASLGSCLFALAILGGFAVVLPLLFLSRE